MNFLATKKEMKEDLRWSTNTRYQSKILWWKSVTLRWSSLRSNTHKKNNENSKPGKLTQPNTQNYKE